MSRSKEEVIIREVAKSSGIRWGTTAAFCFGRIYVERIGFASIPVVGMRVISNATSSALVPIVRAAIFQHLERAGLESEILEFSPTVATRSKRKRFVDENAGSPTVGKNKMGVEMDFHFEIKKIHAGHFTWNGCYGKIG